MSIFDRHVIIVRDAKGGKDRVVMLPRSAAPALRLQMLAARAQWEVNRQAQRGGVETPHALEAKWRRAALPARWMRCRRLRHDVQHEYFAILLIAAPAIFYGASGQFHM
jgi:integrase